ncbi:MAG: beta-CASP ribonuclease aCPSF1 [Candidatus Woesearchaeota archaeon]|jgi:hypothetical protein
MVAKILKEVLRLLPNPELISDSCFEGANIVLYTKDKDYALDNKGTIKAVVNDIKKRVELRPDPSIAMDMEKAEKIIRDLIDKEAGLTAVLFDPMRSEVTLEVDKPGIAIGKSGDCLREIKEKTFWVPKIIRNAAIKANLIENIRSVLFQNSDYRRKFLDKVGERIYNGWIRQKKNEWVRLTYLGSGREVGRSCLFLQTPESRILLDCGINVAGDEHNAYPFLEAPEFKIDELDAVIISHAHLDHTGFLPYLIKYGYKGPIYCTAPTRDIMSLLLLDCVKIGYMQGRDALFTQVDVKEMVKQTITLDYEEVTDITPDIRITLYNAGHILGSSMVHIHVGNGLHNMLYSADMKFGKTDLLDPAITRFPRLETLCIESTYGGKDNVLPPKEECDKQFFDILKTTLERGGKVLCPVLGVGRAQEVLLIVEKCVKEGTLPKVPVYIDGMVWDITAIHTAYPEYMNATVRKQIFHEDVNPFLNPIFKHVGSQKERKEVIEHEGACVIIATSGMLVGGASVQYLQELAEDKKHSIIFSCYQGPGSLGKRIVEGEREISFENSNGRPQIMKVNMDVHIIEGLSGHSGRNQLLNFLARCTPKPKKVIINHGESSRALDLASTIHKTARCETAVPRNLETIRIK